MTERSQFALLRERRFGPFFCVQFLGAFNDNVFKQALVIMLAYQTASFTTMSSDALQNLAQALFILPFLLFSATAGQIADKYEKSTLISITVALELGIMALGAAGLILKDLSILLAALFLDEIARALENGELVGIFPEGRLTSDGEIGEFRGGVSRIVDRTPVPVIPMALSGLWQSLFARNKEKMKHAPTRLFPKVRVVVGGALPPEAVSPLALRGTVKELRGDWR